ncbi:3-methyl-2-oxobutanoate hydroxymethyltransferase [Ascobolus immersus RN42]|uniref:3-methyl-2-oxobutanoate hydroxymethyltransferase n=1 Tax=Ascobolus immersus RN42 TaxID=1160509 RepID=A0A3N4HWZ9_ASCIM|nr:3-methyl-2-oxobutanoate hydroxymethyltransferase [Ascobolus immersus RN42]
MRTALSSRLLSALPTLTTSVLRTSTPLLRTAAYNVQTRFSSHSPLAPTQGPPPKKKTLETIRNMYKKGTPIVMMTAHDFPSGLAADMAGVDMVLIGDSLAMVALGMEDTNEVELEDIIHHSKAVSRAVKSAFLVADLPMGSYEISPEHALTSALRLIQKGRSHSVKLEGGLEMAPTIRKLTSVGIPVLGHIGLTPQRQHSLGGFKVQGKSVKTALALLDDAFAVQEAGAFGMVLECIPAPIAEVITEELSIPTIGIGAGNPTSGQVLVQTDMSGNYPRGRFIPKFVKVYADIFEQTKRAIEQYAVEVRERSYPEEVHSYKIDEKVVDEFKEALEKRRQRGGL